MPGIGVPTGGTLVHESIKYLLKIFQNLSLLPFRAAASATTAASNFILKYSQFFRVEEIE